MRFKCVTSFVLIVIVLTSLFSPVSAIDTGLYSGNYDAVSLICDSGAFYGVCRYSDSADGICCGGALNSVDASSFISGDSYVLDCFYYRGEFYAVCIGDSYDVPDRVDIMVYKGESPQTAYLCSSVGFADGYVSEAVADSSLYVYYASNIYKGRICAVYAYTGATTVYELGESVTSIACDVSSCAVAAACSGNVYIKNPGASDFLFAASLPESITKMYFLSDGHILCNGRYIIDKNGNYSGCAEECSYDSQGCCGDGCFYLTSGSNVYKYDSSLALEQKYSIQGRALDCAVCGSTLAVLTENGGKISVVGIESADTGRNDNSGASSKAPAESQDKSKHKTDSDTATEQASVQQKKDKSGGDTDCTVIYITPGTTVSKLLNASEIRKKTVVCTNYSGKVVTSGKIGTGARVTVKATGDKYDIVLTGDVTGEGNINTKDIEAMCSALVGNEPLNLTQSYAADVNKDGTVDLLDLLCNDEFTRGKFTPEY